MTTAQTIQQLVDKWKVSKALLAFKMNMPEGTFYNKISANHTTQFSDKELNQLCNILIEMREDLSAVESADFNDALKILSDATF